MTGVGLPEPNRELLANRESIVAELRRLIAPEAIVDDLAGREVFAGDAFLGARAAPLAVVFPTRSIEVARIVRFCLDNGIRILARGAGTSLSGAAVPQADAIVISLAKMDRVLDIDVWDRLVTAEAGITGARLSQAVAVHGFDVAPNPWSRAVSTLGGNIAMNASGANALRHGATVQYLAALTLIDGEANIVEIGDGVLDATGYDWLGLIAGSEGGFGIVTEATLRMVPRADAKGAAFYGFASIESAVAFINALNGTALTLTALELLDNAAVQACEAHVSSGYPAHAAALVLLETEGTAEEVQWALDYINNLAQSQKPLAKRIADGAEDIARLWRGWDGVFGAMARPGAALCVDGTVPLAGLEWMLQKIDALSSGHHLPMANIYRAGDGTLRSFVQFDPADATDTQRAQHARAAILRHCVEVGGTLSGEHGIGLEKRELMGLQFSVADLAQQMRLKSVFDPKWQFNVGKVFPPRARPEGEPKPVEQPTPEPV